MKWSTQARSLISSPELAETLEPFAAPAAEAYRRAAGELENALMITDLRKALDAVASAAG